MASRTCVNGPPDRSADRRGVLAGLGAALAAPLLRSGSHAAVPGFRRNVGAIEVMVVSDGALTVPLSFSLPEIPPAEAAAFLVAHRLPAAGGPIATNVSLVASGRELVFVDAGSGANFQPSAGKLAENMEAAGIDPTAITKIVFTHAHADHLWGAIDDFDDSERFPNASYVISAAEWDFWVDPGTPARMPDWLKGMALGSARILKRLEGKLERRKAGEAVAAGLTFVETAGHTPGHMSVMVESGGERLLIGADALSHPAVSFARPDWRWGSDYDSDRAVATRRRLLDRLAFERTALIGFHLPWPGHGRVERNGTEYRFVPL
jgi:glyoxylase-like metal-dependent hydrolase (beta-lactamase superfamily II)